jgi:hypothetical protein
MAKNSPSSGGDASYIEPKFVPNEFLLGRDDSGGPDYQPYTAKFGDGGKTTGAKSHLSASGGSGGDDGDEQPSTVGARNKSVSP